MKFAAFIFALFLSLPAFAGTPEVGIPEKDKALIRSADTAEVTGTNAQGIEEDFTIHNAKAMKQFIGLLTDDRYMTAPKSLKPDFKSHSRYHIRLISNGSVVLELDVIAESIIDLPGDDNYYTETERHSDDLLMAPLRRLR